MIAFIFPGQGSQQVGMGKSIYDKYPSVQNLFNQANGLLGYSLSELCFNGPEDKLKQTQFAQPALYTVSMAVYKILMENGIKADMLAGHSMGEYSALTAADVIDFESGLRLVCARGTIMSAAGKNKPGTMAAVMGMAENEIQAICEQISAGNGTVVIANYNCPGQLVISGDINAVELMVAKLKEMKKKAILLPVSGAFHSPLLNEANNQFIDILNSVEFKPASIPVISNATAILTNEPIKLKSALCRQMISSVLWEQSIQKMIESGIKIFIEVGTGNVLSGLIKKINREISTYQTSDAESLEATIAVLKSNAN